MWPPPDDPEIARRMRNAHSRACRLLGVRRASEATDVWGWHARTIAAPVVADDGPAWLRIAHAPIDQIIDTFWTGAVQAQQLPRSIPRPRLRRWHDWTHRRFAYRAELYDHTTTNTVSTDAAITRPSTLTAAWWDDVRAALATLAAIPTHRLTIQPGFLDWAMPHYLGISHTDYTAIPWTTAHGDFHFANLCGPDLAILDWEGWGLAPAGYDAATLHTYSLLASQTAARVRHELGHLLTSDAGRYAELAAITDLLHAAAEGVHPELATAARQRATVILEQSPLR